MTDLDASAPLDLAVWHARLRGAAAEHRRQGRLEDRRREAFHRAMRDDGADYSPADVALFGPRDQLLREGPVPPDRLGDLVGPGFLA